MSALEVQGHGPSACLNAKLFINVDQMGLHRGKADIETFTDVPVGSARNSRGRAPPVPSPSVCSGPRGWSGFRSRAS